MIVTPRFRAHRWFVPAALFGALLGACDKPQPLGDVNAIIVGMPDEAWEELEPIVEEGLEPRTFTVRDERIFNVTQVDPSSPQWQNLRRFRQVLLIGEPADPWVAEALDKADGPLPSLPAVVRAGDVWAQNQQVTVAVVPPGAGEAAARPLIPAIGERYLEQFQTYVRRRMFASGADSALADSLREAAGFSILLPDVYYGRPAGTNAFLVRNDYPDPSQLIRSVLVTWRPAGQVPLTAETALRWRDEVAGRFYDPAQVMDTAETQVRALGEGATRGVQVQGVWSNPPGSWPAAGPFITRLVPCPAQGRDYLLDAWLYAPSKDKYEYMLQLDTILNSFACGEAGAAA